MNNISIIKNKLGIISALNRYTIADTSKLGSHAKGNILCPFHNEKSPSFQVDTVNNTWHCYGGGDSKNGCGGGDVINLYAKARGVSNEQAIRMLKVELGLAQSTKEDKDRYKQSVIDNKLKNEAIKKQKDKESHDYDKLCDIHRYLESMVLNSTIDELKNIPYVVEGEHTTDTLIDNLLNTNRLEQYEVAKAELKGVVSKWEIIINEMIFKKVVP